MKTLYYEDELAFTTASITSPHATSSSSPSTSSGTVLVTGLLVGIPTDDDRIYLLGTLPTPSLPLLASGQSDEDEGDVDESVDRATSNRDKTHKDNLTSTVQHWNASYADWMTAHIIQVSRMLIGGVYIVGLYLSDQPSYLASLDTNNNTFQTILQTIAAQYYTKRQWFTNMAKVNFDVVVMKYLPNNKVTCEYLSTQLDPNTTLHSRSSSSSSLSKTSQFQLTLYERFKSMEMKKSKFASSLQRFQCRFPLNFSLFIDQPTPQYFSSQITNILMNVLKSLNISIATLDGKLIEKSMTVEMILEQSATATDPVINKNKPISMKSNGSKRSESRNSDSRFPKPVTIAHDIVFLQTMESSVQYISSTTNGLRFSLTDSESTTPFPLNSAYRIHLNGIMQAMGIVNVQSRTPMGTALNVLHEDILHNLACRLAIFFEDWEDVHGDFDVPIDATVREFQIPRRVFFPLSKDKNKRSLLTLSDYIMSHETLEDVCPRVNELCGIEVESDSFSSIEPNFPPKSPATTFSSTSSPHERSPRIVSSTATISSTSSSVVNHTPVFSLPLPISRIIVVSVIIAIVLKFVLT